MKIKAILTMTTVGASLFNTAYAQASDAKWQIMPEVTFNYQVQTGTKQQREWAYAIWKNQINSTPTNPINPNTRLPSFILLGSAVTPTYNYSFTSLNAAGKCIDPLNGKDAYATYSICPLQIMKINRSNGSGNTEIKTNFCYLNDQDDVANNHTEMAFDPKNKIAHFRVVMFGKQVPECNRSFKLD